MKKQYESRNGEIKYVTLKTYEVERNKTYEKKNIKKENLTKGQQRKVKIIQIYEKQKYIYILTIKTNINE